MKFDKRLMESGIVAAFSLMLSVSSVYGANAASQVPDDQTVELSAEPAEVSDKAEAATKVKKIHEIVAVSITENEPEQEAEEQENLQDKDTTKNASGPGNASVGILAEALKEEASEPKTEEASDIEEVEDNVPDAEEKDSDAKEAGTEQEEASGAEEGQKQEEASKAETEQKPEDTEESGQPEEADEDAEEAPAVIETAEGEPEQKEDKEEADGKEPARDGLVAVGTEEVSPWATKLLPNVEDYLNIRTEPSDEAELAGKLHKGASADILEQGEEWTKISSGSVEGYVKNEFCVTGLAAEELANQVGTVYATAVTGGVRIREQASTSEDTTVMDVLEEGGKAKVDTEAEAPEGWVVVKMEEGVGYVSADYVDVELKLGKAISIEEERAAIAAAEAEKAKKAQQAQASSSTSQRGAVAASYDDVTLLGALIQCEAGSEPYEGKLAVGAVVMNRLRAGYAGSISGVIYQSGQFTPASSGALANVLASGVSGSCIQAAQEAIGGASNVGGATSFRNAASGASGIVIGNHVFF